MPPRTTRARRTLALAATVALAAAAGPRAFAAAQIGPINPGATSVVTPVASNLTAAVDLRAPVANDANNAGKLFVTQQSGQVVSIQNGTIQGTFLDVSSRLAPFRTQSGGYDERGLLGFAFDPDFANVGTPGFHKVYTWTSEVATALTPTYATPASGTSDHNDVLLEWTTNATGTAVTAGTTPRVVLSIGHPSFNHDAGSIHFGPDKMLYLADGDGGASYDNGNGHVAGGNAQSTAAGNLLGKILRIDPHGTNGPNGQYGIPADNPFAASSTQAKEIYAYGLRNVYRMSFDRGGTHDLIAGDVGQNNVEEVNRITSGGNYGWRLKEGTFLITDNGNGSFSLGANSPGSPGNLIDPLVEYNHTQGTAIVGGFVYRGSIMTDLIGKYIFADYSAPSGTGRLFYADLSTGQINEFTAGVKNLGSVFIKGMGEDANGEIYVLADTALGPGSAGHATAYLLTPEPSSVALFALAAFAGLGKRRRR